MRPFTTLPAFGDQGAEVASLQDMLHVLSGLNLLDPNQDPGDGSLASGTDWRRRFEQEREQQVFGLATQLRIRQSEVQHMQDSTPSGAVDRRVAHWLERLLEENQLLDDGTRLVVVGQVTDSNADPREDVKIAIADEDLRRPQEFRRQGQPLSLRTNGQGFYRFEYTPEDFSLAEGATQQAADLLVRVLTEDGAQVAVGRPRQWPARRVEVIDVRLPPVVVRTVEFERLQQRVLPLLAGQGRPRLPPSDPPAFDDLAPHELEGRDFTFLERRTGVPLDELRAWVAAAAMERDALRRVVRIEVQRVEGHMTQMRAFFYAWCRDGLKTDLDAALRSGLSRWVAVQKRAVSLDRVAPEDWSGVFGLLERLRRQ